MNILTVRRRVAALVLSAAALISGVALAPAAAAAGSMQPNSFACNGSTITVRPPRVWTNENRPETVYWAPALYRWQGGRWTMIVQARLATAAVNNQGFAVTAWTDLAAHYGVIYRSFTIHRSGHYRVGLAVIWNNDRSSAVRWAPSSSNPNRGYCTF